MFFNTNRIWLVGLILIFTSCSRKPESLNSHLPRRIGILIFENLSSDVSLDWLGSAAAGVLSSQLALPPSIVPVELGSMRDAASANLNELVHGYFSVAGDEVRLTAQLRNPLTFQNGKLLTVSGKLSAGALPLIDALARQINPAAHAYETKNEVAVRELFKGIAAPSQNDLMAHLELSLRADPAFGAAHLDKIKLLMARGDSNGAEAALAEAARHASSFTELERAQMGMMRASQGGSRADRMEALSRFIAAVPGDVQALDSLANLQVAAKKFPDAIKTYQTALKVAPANILLWNSLAYVQAFAGDSGGALSSLEAYRKLAPNDANVDDTSGEISFLFGRFGDAERHFVEANRRDKALVNGQELYRAAVAAFLAGNSKSAAEHFQAHLTVLQNANDSLIPVRKAIWAYQTGDPSAVSQLQSFAARKESPAEVASVAHSQLAIWLLDSDQREKAREEVVKAAALAATPSSRNFAAVSGFLTGAKVPASEWRLRAERAAPAQLALQRQVLGYALLLSRQYDDAVPGWKAAYDDAGLDAMGEPKVLLAYAYRKAGRNAEAAELMKTGVLPPKSLDLGLPSLLVPYYFAIRK